MVRWAFQLSAFDKLVTKPLVKIQKMDDIDFLAQLEAVDAFTAGMIAYPGRTFGQLYHRFAKGNELSQGSIHFGDRTIELKNIKAPTLVFGGATDGIAPAQCVKPVVDMLTGAKAVRWEIVPGGHLGMLTGRAARNTTWRILDEWVETWSSDADTRPKKARAAKKTAASQSRRAPATKKAAAAKKAAATKKTATAKKTAAKNAVAKKAATADAIGVNPTRRYGSSGSRSLSS